MQEIGSKILIATHNAGKFAEFVQLFQPLGIEPVFAADLGLPEPAETGTTFHENARIKAHAAVAETGLCALADDSGIEIDALDKAPGVYTADWAETGNGRDFRLAMRKAHRLLEARGAPLPRTARFRCTLALAWPNGEDALFDGAVEGQVVWPMRGETGHGYDPIFQPDGYEITFGEMPEAEKNRISHRAVALRKLVSALAA